MTPAELKTRRVALKISQRCLGEILGVSTRVVEEWEGGRTPIKNLVNLALETIERNPSRFIVRQDVVIRRVANARARP